MVLRSSILYSKGWQHIWIFNHSRKEANKLKSPDLVTSDNTVTFAMAMSGTVLPEKILHTGKTSRCRPY